MASRVISHAPQIRDARHMDRKVFKMRELRGAGIVEVAHISTDANLADLFTKILDRGTFERLRDQIMIRRHREHDMNELD